MKISAILAPQNKTGANMKTVMATHLLFFVISISSFAEVATPPSQSVRLEEHGVGNIVCAANITNGTGVILGRGFNEKEARAWALEYCPSNDPTRFCNLANQICEIDSNDTNKMISALSFDVTTGNDQLQIVTDSTSSIKCVIHPDEKQTYTVNLPTKLEASALAQYICQLDVQNSCDFSSINQLTVCESTTGAQPSSPATSSEPQATDKTDTEKKESGLSGVFKKIMTKENLDKLKSLAEKYKKSKE